ncbi:hypothetical protein M5D96_003303 [Drosophila gunungcola]|uniref:Uncharacterized protein n=1 Tax=Drosophila gunungcola TaxID=103775 RepID=A0A9P9YRY9_9MUSC|nr:hypothetical protein M5D96_003303 [Drosophila gunungcola]
MTSEKLVPKKMRLNPNNSSIGPVNRKIDVGLLGLANSPHRHRDIAGHIQFRWPGSIVLRC